MTIIPPVIALIHLIKIPVVINRYKVLLPFPVSDLLCWRHLHHQHAKFPFLQRACSRPGYQSYLFTRHIQQKPTFSWMLNQSLQST